MGLGKGCHNCPACCNAGSLIRAGRPAALSYLGAPPTRSIPAAPNTVPYLPHAALLNTTSIAPPSTMPSCLQFYTVYSFSPPLPCTPPHRLHTLPFVALQHRRWLRADMNQFGCCYIRTSSHY